MKKIKIQIDNREVEVDEGTTILKAAEKLNIHIPTLCHHEDLCIAGNCRVCVVEVEGANLLSASCATPVMEGMKIHTNSMKVRNTRRTILDMLLSEHAGECTSCTRSGNCELQTLAGYYASPDNALLDISIKSKPDTSSPSITKDDSKCIRCQRCVRTCEEIQKVGALSMSGKGEHAKVSTFFELPLNTVICTNCGQCVTRCPTGALVERSYIDEVWDALSNPDVHTVVQTAPAVRVGLGEALGHDPGGRFTGKMVSALRNLGFDAVFDTNFTADLTIIEEGSELLARLTNVLTGDKSAQLPMFTSCSPGWIKFIEHRWPHLLGHLSTCKSPQQMFGPLAKTRYPEATGVNPQKICSISIMPCTAKKFEADRPEMRASGFKDVDYVLTTRELAKMIKQAGIDFDALEESECDSMLGKHTGAAVIFGATGGVMEAAIRTVYELVTGRQVPFENLNITPVRGMEGIREATLKIEGTVEKYRFLEGVEVKVAIAHGLINADKLMEAVNGGNAPWHFIEVMACPGGCLSGGGQPIPTSPDIRAARANAIYEEDASLLLRKSHENPEITKLYEEFLVDGPLGHTSHHLLHTHYTPRP
ncbi:[FeFe] hydrogenase, group A [Myxococcota bacterium]|nr:[FeFe] hydrogenase, group A [Myxococcota bacterium]MBU1380332.1 [FeFe] hydrogenase, group A [Myxococcota bacterium]MBU1496334.1 [FeFe] hydrogenase, group A [Myxococcota bacterium]